MTQNTETFTEIQENPIKEESYNDYDVCGVLISILLGVIMIALGFAATIDRGGFYDPDRMY